MSEDVYARLGEFLNKLPGGFPPTPKGIEIRILKKIFTPQEAELVMQLKPEPEEVSAIASRLGLSEQEASEKLEEMAKKGLIFRVRKNGKAMYQAFQFIVGIYEFQLDRIDKELAQLMEEYSPYIGMIWLTTKTRQMRVVPVGSAVDATPAVATYNKAREMVKAQDLIVVSPCICRRKEGLLGNDCKYPSEVCLSFGDFAQYGIDNGGGRQINQAEALKVLDLAEESGLVLSPSNTQELAFICCCCSCCCGILKSMKMLPQPALFVKSDYQAVIDPDLCNLCETCLERCHLDAIKEADESMQINKDRCIGCGLCIPTCPEEAISLVAKPEAQAPPQTFNDMLTMLAKERGVN